MSTKLPFASVSNRQWEVVVIGAGVGGGTAAYALAQAGVDVLLLERGPTRTRELDVAFWNLEEKLKRASTDAAKFAVLRTAGLFWEDVDDVTRPQRAKFRPYLGNIAGGSSALFGMTFERFRPEDFSSIDFFPNAPDANIPTEWPISYSEMTPYYEAAERLYRVRGTPDPLAPNCVSYGYDRPPEFSQGNRAVVDALRKNGLHPYYQPMACEFRQNCRECVGSICPDECKNDSYKCCIEPAVRDFGATLLDECDVVYLGADHRRISEIHCVHRGVPIVIKARSIVISAGALQTPALLLRSRSADWPKGLANRSNQVGRNFMRHFIDFYFVNPGCELRPGDLTKQVSFNDFYIYSETKLGTVQSLGPVPTLSAAVKQFEDSLEQIRPSLAQAAFLLRPVVRLVARSMMKKSLIYAGILEDLPYPDNRVTYDNTRERIQLSYHVHDEARQRISLFRKLCLRSFKPLPVSLVKMAHCSWNIAHQAGTCRFGTNLKNSVLDRNCRAHDLENLFVLDSSFMPTSAGINPSLTIAANALRVAPIIGEY